MKCAICGKEINSREANNGEPLVRGKVCNECNLKVIAARIQEINSGTSYKKEEDK